jgi:hypothetical protein
LEADVEQLAPNINKTLRKDVAQCHELLSVTGQPNQTFNLKKI